MSCCFGTATDGTDPKKSISGESNPSSNKPIIPVNKPEDNKIEYSVTVKTGDFRNSGTNGPVYINIFGRDDKRTGDLLLSGSDRPFTQNSTRKFQVNAMDIGKPQRIIIRHEDKSTGWYVDYVEISVHNFLIRFVANRWLNQLKNDRKLEMELFGSEQPAVMYNVEIQTGDEQIEPLDSPVYIQIYGTTTITPKLYLESKNPSFTKDSKSKFTVSSNNVGEIQRIIIGHEGLGKVNDWYLKNTKVQMLGQQQEYTVEKCLSLTQGDQRLFVELSKNEPPPPVPPKYLIDIQTADVSQNHTNENIEMIIRGSDGQIEKISLKDYAKSKNKQLFQKGNLDEFEIEHQNIGNIESVTIGFSDSQQTSAWLLEYLDIKYAETITHFRAECWLSNRLGPNFTWLTLKPAVQTNDIQYKIIIETGQSGIDANVILCLFGDEETTSNLALKTTKDGSEAKFERDSTVEFDLQAVDVGRIKKINIGHDGKGNEQEWFLKTIQIEKKDEQYIFKVNRWLSEEKEDHKTFIDLLPEGQKTPTSSPALTKDQANYLITIVTSSDDHAGTDSGVLMTIIGDKDITKQFQLTNTKQGEQAIFETGKINEFEMELDDVGHINKINIGQDGKGSHAKWKLQSVQIQKGSENYNFSAKEILDQTTPFIELTPVQPEKAPTPEPAEVKAPTPEPVKVRTPTPEPTKTKTPTPEPTKAKTPEPVKVKTPTPEPTKTKTPEPVKVKTPTPEPTKAKTPEPVKVKTPTPEPTKTKTPEPVKVKTPTPEPTKAKTPEPVKVKTPTPEPTKAKTPEPVKVKTPTPEPTKTKTPTPEPSKVKTPRSLTPEEKTAPTKEITYKISIQSNSNPAEDSNFYLIIHGQNDQTNKLYFKDSQKSNKKNELEFQATDIGKISKIMIGQESDTTWEIDNITIKRNNQTTTFNAERTIEANSQIELTPSAIPKKTEATYKILLQTGSSQEEGDHSNLNIIIFGQNGQTKQIPLNENTKLNKKKPFKKDEKIDFEYKTLDVGKISKILLDQDSTNQGILWHIIHLTIKRNNDQTTFNIARKFEGDTKQEFFPSPLIKKSETPRKTVKTNETVSKIVVKTKDTDYDIIISSGEQAIQVPVILKIHGENGIVQIPLTKTKTGDQPFQAKSTHEFSSHTNDVGKIKKITIEHQGTEQDLLWHLKTVQIKKGTETYNFNANVRLDYKENKVNLYPVGALSGQQKEDYVQSELRRLRESLRSESAKLHPPPHKAYEPFVYNDLSPYFDTSPVERAIYSSVDSPQGYYTRVTALRIVEPWEAYGMDYGVSYELLKQRKARSLSARRPVSKSGDDSIDRKQGSTHLPRFPCVNLQKPAEYSRPLTMNDVPKIRSLIRTRYTAQANNQIEKDYKRTHDDFYRMQLDNLAGYHESNRDNMVRVYHSYLENTPGSKKAVRELCKQIAGNNTKSSVETTA